MRTTIRKTGEKARLTDVKLDEISFVGKGDNKGAHILLLKSHPNPIVALGKEFAGENKEELLQQWFDNDVSKADGIFKDEEAVMFADLLADKTIRDKVWGMVWMLEDSICSIMCDDTGADKTEMLQTTVEQFKTAITALTKTKGGKEDMPELKKAKDELAAAQLQVAELTKERDSLVTENEELRKKVPVPEADKIDKSQLPEAVVKQLNELEAINKNHAQAIEKMQDETASTEAIAKAAEIPAISADGVVLSETLKTLKKSAPSLFDNVFALLKAAHARIQEGGLFSEVGKQGNDGGASAYDQLVAKATDLRKTMPELTAEQAFDRVYKAEDKLRTQYQAEQRKR